MASGKRSLYGIDGLVVFLCGLHAWWLAKLGVLHGDLLYFESIYRDQRLSGHPLRHFQFTEAIFAFPDLLLFYVVRPVSPSPAWAVVFYNFVFMLIESGILYAMFKRVWKDSFDVWKFGACLAAFFFLTDTTSRFFVLASAPEHHGALNLLELLWLWQIVDLREHKSRNLAKWLALNFVCVFGFGLSDLLVVPAVLAPAALSILVSWWQGQLPTKMVRQLAIVNILGLVSGGLVKWMLKRNEWITIDPSNMVTLSWRHFILAAQNFTADLGHFAQTDWIFLCACAVIIALSWRRPAGANAVWRQTFLRLALFTCTFKLTAILINGRWDNVTSLRYFQELFLYPVLVTSFWFLPRLLKRGAAQLTILILSLVSLTVLLWPPPGLQLVDKPELTSCLESHLDELPTPWGLSDFWVAKLVTFTSTKGLVINQIKKNLSAYLWMNSPEWYAQDPLGRTILRYSYLVSFTPDFFNNTRARYGEPAKIFSCRFADRDMMVMIYPQGIAPTPPDQSAVR